MYKWGLYKHMKGILGMYKGFIQTYCTILISSARGVTCDHMTKISISANHVGTCDTSKTFGHCISIEEVEGHNEFNCALSQLANLTGTWDRHWILATTNRPVMAELIKMVQ